MVSMYELFDALTAVIEDPREAAYEWRAILLQQVLRFALWIAPPAYKAMMVEILADYLIRQEKI